MLNNRNRSRSNGSLVPALRIRSNGYFIVTIRRNGKYLLVMIVSSQLEGLRLITDRNRITCRMVDTSPRDGHIL